jgi:plastocyanin
MHHVLKIVSCSLVLSLAACGGKSNTATTPTGSAPTAAAVNGCTDYKDMTDAGANSIPWNETISSSDLRCIKIKVGATVGFTGNFTTHPMKSANGDAPNPFDGALAAVSNPGTAEEQTNVEFTKPGTFGYTCSVHPKMTGAVIVVE